MKNVYDVLIIGGGVTGLGAAYHLTKNLKKRTLLLEQFPFPHQFGSSTGHSRITRQLYENDFNCILMKEATSMWEELEHESKYKLFLKLGFLTFGLQEEIKNYISAIKNSGISAYMISTKEAEKIFPILNIPSNCKILYDPIAGVLRADKCLEALMKQSLRHGLEFHEMEKVVDVSVISDDEIQVKSYNNIYISKSIIISSGVWSSNILNKLKCELPIQPSTMLYGYFLPKNLDKSIFDYYNFPSFLYLKKLIYGCTGFEYPGCVKIGDFNTNIMNPDILDTNYDNSYSKVDFLNNIQRFLTNFIPHANTTPVKIIKCVILKTPDGQPILDRHPKYKNVIIGCGFSGCGFKTGIIHGKLLANLAVNDKINYEMKHFSMKRFI